jgi:uncharacterized protein YodC (DUF2158 family)
MSKRKPAITIGATVRLNGGGPVMTVERGGKEPKGRLVFQCVWIVDGVSRRDVFYADTLELC